METQAPPQRRGAAGILAVALAGLLALVPIGLGLLITSPSVQAGAGNLSGFRPLTPPVPAASPAVLSPLPPGTGALVAVIRQTTTLRDAPGGRTLHALGRRTEYGSPQTLWVLAPRGPWLGVLTPLVGNGRIGWIPSSAASLERVDWELKVSLSTRRLLVLNGGRVIHSYAVAIGRPEAPTPTGRFAVTDRLAPSDPTGPYGCCILALSALAPHAIQNWSGGNRIAIHSTPETASIGQPVSHGCLRLTLAEGRWLMSHIPLGTPTVITSN